MKTVKGDLIQMFMSHQFDIIIHGCNCFNTMGAGFARQIAENFPGALEVDQMTEAGDITKLGNWTIYDFYSAQTSEYWQKKYPEKFKGGANQAILNLYTQYEPGPNLCMPALELGLFKIGKKIDKMARIGMPMIGCGIAGGNWDEVKVLVEKHMGDNDLTVVEYAPVTA